MDIFKRLTIALEADGDDITQETEDDRANLNQETDTDTDEGGEDFIFGEDNEDEPEPTDDGEEEETKDTNPEDDEGGGEEDFSFGGEEDSEEIPEIEKKIKLRENMVLLHSIISTNAKLLNDYTPDIDNADLSKVLYNISNVLGESEEILFDELVNGFKKKSYTSLLRTYVAINRVFELSQKTVEKYFENIDIIKNETRKKNTKHSS